MNLDSPKSQRNFSMDSQELPKQRAMAALKSLFVGDALAMPVHWYYSVMDIAVSYTHLTLPTIHSV